MYQKIASTIGYPQWAGQVTTPTRWRCLDQMDRLLDGTFYGHLRYGFYEETNGAGDRIPLHDRRPSSQYHLPRMVARWSARKLWTGRHVPRVKHDSKSVTKSIGQLLRSSRFYDVMMNATILGSVGSVAVVFRVQQTAGEDPQVSFRVWRAKYCSPQFDDFNNMTCLRVHCNVSGASLLERGLTMSADGEPVRADMQYWWVRDYGDQDERTYLPPRIEDWNPVEGWTRPNLSFRDATPPVAHGLGFVPGVWIRNLSGGCDVDGIGTWEDSIPISVEIDYLLSQASRGTRYNCAPELVLVGELAAAAGEDLARGPADYIHLRASYKQADGDTLGEGKASLLEMTGDGIKAAQELIDKLRNMALEQIGATRKDPEKLKGVMSGRAMEFLDEDSHDLVMELRSSYGDGALELLRKVVRALGSGGGDPKGLVLDWPRLYQPTPEDLAHLIPALVLAATPIQEPLSPEEAAKIGGGEGGSEAETSTKDGEKGEQRHEAETRTNKSASGASTTVKKEVKTSPVSAGNQGGRPAATPTGGKVLGALLEIEEASAFLRMNMDIDLLPDADEQGVSDSDRPTGTERPPSPDGLGPEEASSGLNMDIPTP